MADKSEDVQSIDDKVTLAKELYATGSRSYLVKSYSDALEDLSKACEMFEIVHGHLADELGLPYLMYAKSLIAVAQQGENKIVDVPDDEEEQKDDDEEQKDVEGEGNDDDDDDDEEDDQETDKPNQADNGTAGKSITNGNGTNGASSSSEPQPGTSSVAEDNQEDDDADSDSPAANLQLAWEVLELAVKIFVRQGAPALSNLAEAYFELAEISFENSHFDTAVMDYKKSEDIRMKLPDDDLRMLSLIQYKIGLSYYMNQSFDESIAAFKKACDILDCRMETAKSKDEKSDKDVANIAELEEMKEEILAKITEIEEMKQQSTEDVKLLLAKFLNGDTDAGQSSSSAASASTSAGESSKPKPTDISHLIKRKKPDTPDDEQSKPIAKKLSI
ncbi:protein NASP homolog [Bradysia coprophila]|uniref:protein NASP homolog n=1 Tax=Bradysia coprophila TaxID=38358 RepID=UPI00187DA206|nr:protein NASP homolog [Bradysia coprophila]